MNVTVVGAVLQNSWPSVWVAPTAAGVDIRSAVVGSAFSTDSVAGTAVATWPIERATTTKARSEAISAPIFRGHGATGALFTSTRVRQVCRRHRRDRHTLRVSTGTQPGRRRSAGGSPAVACRTTCGRMAGPLSTTRRSAMSDDHAIIDVHAGDDLFPLAGTWAVDPTHSALEFVARYAMFTLVRGRFTS